MNAKEKEAREDKLIEIHLKDLACGWRLFHNEGKFIRDTYSIRHLVNPHPWDRHGITGDGLPFTDPDDPTDARLWLN